MGYGMGWGVVDGIFEARGFYVFIYGGFFFKVLGGRSRDGVILVVLWVFVIRGWSRVRR